jgi:hypothetical protein
MAVPVEVVSDVIRTPRKTARVSCPAVIRFFLSIAETGDLMSRTLSIFDTDDRLRSLAEAGDPLERLSTVIDFELFRYPTIAG